MRGAVAGLGGKRICGECLMGPRRVTVWVSCFLGPQDTSEFLGAVEGVRMGVRGGAMTTERQGVTQLRIS